MSLLFERNVPMVSIPQYANANGLTIREVFLKAYYDFVNGNPNEVTAKGVYRDAEAYNVHGTIPHYVQYLLETEKMPA